jgi:hypothetical protein
MISSEPKGSEERSRRLSDRSGKEKVAFQQYGAGSNFLAEYRVGCDCRMCVRACGSKSPFLSSSPTRRSGSA